MGLLHEVDDLDDAAAGAEDAVLRRPLSLRLRVGYHDSSGDKLDLDLVVVDGFVDVAACLVQCDGGLIAVLTPPVEQVVVGRDLEVVWDALEGTPVVGAGSGRELCHRESKGALGRNSSSS